MSREGDHQKVQPANAAGSEKAGRFMPLIELWHEDPGDFDLTLERRAEETKKQQDEIIGKAREEAEFIKKQAYEEGLAEGLRTGKAEGLSEYRRAIGELKPVLISLQNEIDKRNERYEQEILLLIKTMVDRLVHHEISVNPAVIQACLRDTLNYVAQGSRIRVHLHPDDFQRLKEAAMEDPTLLEGKNRLEMVEDHGIKAGGCLLRTDFGEVDATLENARERIYEVVDRFFQRQAAGDGVSDESGQMP